MASAASSYLLPDLLAPGLKLVFCGTAPSNASAAAGAYYAKPGNKFWPTLHRVGITPRRFAPAEFASLLNLGIGLTDLCKRHAGTDAELPADAFEAAAFRRKMRRYRPQTIAFTSKHAARTALGHAVDYGMQSATISGSQLFVLPSPSGLATRYFEIAFWQELRRLVFTHES